MNNIIMILVIILKNIDRIIFKNNIKSILKKYFWFDNGKYFLTIIKALTKFRSETQNFVCNSIMIIQNSTKTINIIHLLNISTNDII